MFGQLSVQSSQHRRLHRDVVSGFTNCRLPHLGHRKTLGCDWLPADRCFLWEGRLFYLLLFVLQVGESPERDVFGHRQNHRHQLIHRTLEDRRPNQHSPETRPTENRADTWMSSRLGLRTMLGMASWMEALKRGGGGAELLEDEEDGWYKGTWSLFLRASRQDLVARRRRRGTKD